MIKEIKENQKKLAKKMNKYKNKLFIYIQIKLENFILI